MIRLTVPSIEEDDLLAVESVLKSRMLVQGKYVGAFEEAVAQYVGTKGAVAVSNCTAALHLALLALGTRPGDIVIVTTYSFTATANAVELCGAQPVFVDIDPVTFNMDPEDLARVLKKLSALKETRQRMRAILPVHTFGRMADMEAIKKIADQYELPVIEDAACALGASLGGRQAGAWGKVGCFSFHPRKAITTGEGGMLTTDDTEIAENLRVLRNHGYATSAPADFIRPGFNYRLTEFQAALGLTQMNKLDRIIAARTSLAQQYATLLQSSPVIVPHAPTGTKPVFQSYVILLPPSAAPQREVIIADLKEAGIETTIGTWHMPLTTYYRTRYGYKPGDYPVTDSVFQRSLTLPMYENMSLAEQEKVVEQLSRALG